jgi:hypothetical protein
MRHSDSIYLCTGACERTGHSSVKSEIGNEPHQPDVLLVVLSEPVFCILPKKLQE